MNLSSSRTFNWWIFVSERCALCRIASPESVTGSVDGLADDSIRILLSINVIRTSEDFFRKLVRIESNWIISRWLLWVATTDALSRMPFNAALSQQCNYFIVVDNRFSKALRSKIPKKFSNSHSSSSKTSQNKTLTKTKCRKTLLLFWFLGENIVIFRNGIHLERYFRVSDFGTRQKAKNISRWKSHSDWCCVVAMQSVSSVWLHHSCGNLGLIWFFFYLAHDATEPHGAGCIRRLLHFAKIISN